MLYLDHLRAEAFLFYSVIVGRAVVQRGDIAQFQESTRRAWARRLRITPQDLRLSGMTSAIFIK